MKKYALYGFLLVGLSLWSACQKVNDKNPMLVGRWTGKTWLIAGQPSQQDPTKVYFEFKEDGTYSAGYRTEGEKGTWRTEKDKLYTTAEGRKEIVVRVANLDATALTFQMNRGGVAETIELTKAQ